jgi:hypothetical protein
MAVTETSPVWLIPEPDWFAEDAWIPLVANGWLQVDERDQPALL